MAVKAETITINNKECTRTYSDTNMMIERDGMQYSGAIDPIEYKDERVYIETDIPIEECEATIEDYQEAIAEMGVRINGN